MLVLLFTNITRVRWLDTILAVLTASCIIGFWYFLQPWIFKRLKTVIPIEFLLITTFIGVTYGLDLHGNYNVRILGNMTVGYTHALLFWPKPTDDPWVFEFFFEFFFE